MNDFTASSMEDASVVGFWRLAARDGDEVCLFAMNQQAAGQAFGVQIENCTLGAEVRPTAWRPVRNGFELLNAEGAVTMRFRQVTVDSFDTLDGKYLLERAPMS